MKAYFILQFQMTNRQLKDFGIDPKLGYPLIIAFFIGLSTYLFYKTEFAQYIYIILSLAITSKLSETSRIDFLKICFNKNHYVIVRFTENIISSTPFVLFLAYKQCFLGSIVLASASLLLGLNSFKTSLNYTIPTPFHKRPFEFTEGFRNTFFLFPIAYIITAIAISVDNFNLGIFSLLLIFLIPLGFYSKPENEFFVWSFALTPKQFLIKKIKTAILYTSFLSLPILLSLIFFYSENTENIIPFYVGGCVLLFTVISAKYSAYPHELSLPEGVIIAIGISFPPSLLAFAPYFFIKATNKMQRYLV